MENAREGKMWFCEESHNLSQKNCTGHSWFELSTLIRTNSIMNTLIIVVFKAIAPLNYEKISLNNGKL